MNEYLDVLGHNSTVCCHLCTYARGSTTLLGSKFANGESHGMISATMRGYFQQSAVRDCKPQAETCRQLGMKSTVSSNAQVFLEFCSTLFKDREIIPKTAEGTPVVSHVFDPYRACLIAPDHLLTSHFRDCVTLVLKPLPSKAYTSTCEIFTLEYLHEAMLPTQNRLIGHEKEPYIKCQ